MKRRVLVFILLLVCCAPAQQSRPVCEGFGARPLGGAQRFAEGGGLKSKRLRAPAAHGRFFDSNRIVLEGTWSARRVNASAKLTVPHWQGTWTARAGAGRALYGTWQADLAGFSGKTFEDMLKRTVEQQVSGSWRSGHAQGNWWLQGSKW